MTERFHYATKICRHCRQPKVNRPRGLCWTCYYTSGVRELYPSTSKYARRGVGAGNFKAAAAAYPTPAAPGSPEKLAVLEERARLKQTLWHPYDGLPTAARTVSTPQGEGDDMPVTVIHHAKDFEARGVATEYPTPIDAAVALLGECSLPELNYLELFALRQVKREVAQRERAEHADLGGEAGAA